MPQSTNQQAQPSGYGHASRLSNKILHKLLFSDEIAPYPMKRFQKTVSKHQVIYQTANGQSQPQAETSQLKLTATQMST